MTSVAPQPPYYPSGPQLPAELDQLLERVDQLGRERIGPRAPIIDREARHPLESWRDLWEQGLLQLMVPREYGGMGADMLTYALVIERLARYCAATAMTLNMHSTVMSFIAALGTEQQKRENFALVVDQGKIFGSWGSEPAVSINRTYLRELRVAPHNGGYLLNGTKFFCTMAGAAERVIVWGTLDGYDNYVDGAVQVIVAKDNPGFTIVGEWDTLGMRGTVSPGTVFKDCFVEADAMLGQPGEHVSIGITEQFSIGYAAVYLGIATGAYDFTIDYCRTKTFKPDPDPISHDVTIQRHVASMGAQLDAARLVLIDSSSKWERVPAEAHGVLAARAKYVCMEAGLKTTELCMQVIGGRSALKAVPVERAYRDLRVCTLMPPNHDRMLEVIGKHELRLASTIFNVQF